jgi:hypothetical protein
MFDRCLRTALIVSSHVVPVQRMLLDSKEIAEDHHWDSIPHVPVDVFVCDVVWVHDETTDPA